MLKKNKYVAAWMALLLGTSVVFTGCGSDKKENTNVVDEGVAVEMMIVENGSLSLTNQFIGTIMPEEMVYIIPMAQGTVTKTHFEVGDEVKAGDVLFEIDDEGARLQLMQAQLTYNNTKSQVDSNLTSIEDQKTAGIDQLEAQRTGALAQLQGAQTQYFTLKDSVDQGNEALSGLKKQHQETDTMSADEILELAAVMMVSSSGQTGGASMGGIVNGDLDWDVISGNTTSEQKEAVADELRPILKGMLADQIKSIETSIRQAEMSLTTAGTSMDAALESYNLIEQSIYDTVHMDTTETEKQLHNSLELAQLGVDSAKLALSYYDVTTPISGVVISKAVTENAIATSSQPAYVISSGDAMTVTFQVSEAVRNTLRCGNEVSVERNGKNFQGVITEVGNAVNQQTGLFQMKASVEADSEELPSGVSVKLTVETYKADDTIIIPYDAVYYENEGSYVYVAKDGIAVKTPVSTGIFDDANIEIISGLQLQDMLITSWSPRLIDGAKVREVKSEN